MRREIVLTVEADIDEIVSESGDRSDAYRRLSDELESERDRMGWEFKRQLRRRSSTLEGRWTIVWGLGKLFELVVVSDFHCGVEDAYGGGCVPWVSVVVLFFFRFVGV